MTNTINYEHGWRFWLDDCCYRIARGVRALGDAGDVSQELWDEKIKPAVPDMEKHHGVLIRYDGDEDGGSIQVAKHQWVFDLADASKAMGDYHDMVIGLLLGYDSDSIAEFVK
jgi:hypothetical protein